jgi:3-deoxy-D-manno-octulosonic-acid transferase
VQVTGSIKFDLTIDPQAAGARRRVARAMGAERPVWIAASTHEGEDEVVLAAHRQLLQLPRCAADSGAAPPRALQCGVRAVPQQGFATVRRSTGEPVTAHTSVLLGDTMGELLFLYALADSAFVGGSLVATGGHNPLEPAALAKPVLMGPHLFNFLEISAMLRDAGVAGSG